MRILLLGVSVLALSCSTVFAQQPYTSSGTTEAKETGVQVPPYDPTRGPRKGTWEAYLTGQGLTAYTKDGSKNDKNTAVGIEGSIGYFFFPWLEIGGRQDVFVQTGDDFSDNVSGRTRAFLDFQLPFGWFQPFVGANVGYQYGEALKDDYFGGPEGGVKVYVAEETFLIAKAEYSIVNSTNIDRGTTTYTIGLGLNF